MATLKPLPLDYSKARGQIERLVPVPSSFLDEDWLKALRGNAFTIASIEQVRVLQDVLDSLQAAVDSGTTFKDWRDNLDISEVEGFSSARMETIFRTNIQSFYEQGNVEAAGDIVDTHPYFMYSAVLDARTRPSHAARDGTILPQDDPFWDRNTPPIDFNCRCALVAITEEEAAARGGETTQNDVTQILDDAPLTKGWDYDKKNTDRKLNKIFRDAADEMPADLRKEFEKHFEAKDQIAELWLEKTRDELGLNV